MEQGISFAEAQALPKISKAFTKAAGRLSLREINLLVPIAKEEAQDGTLVVDDLIYQALTLEGTVKRSVKLRLF